MKIATLLEAEDDFRLRVKRALLAIQQKLIDGDIDCKLTTSPQKHRYDWENRERIPLPVEPVLRVQRGDNRFYTVKLERGDSASLPMMYVLDSRPLSYYTASDFDSPKAIEEVSVDLIKRAEKNIADRTENLDTNKWRMGWAAGQLEAYKDVKATQKYVLVNKTVRVTMPDKNEPLLEPKDRHYGYIVKNEKTGDQVHVGSFKQVRKAVADMLKKK